MKKLIVVLIVIVAAIAGGIWWWQRPAESGFKIISPRGGDVLRIADVHTMKLNAAIPAEYRQDSGETVSLLNSKDQIVGFISCRNTSPTLRTEYTWSVKNLFNLCGGGQEKMASVSEPISPGFYKIEISSGQLTIESGQFELK